MNQGMGVAGAGSAEIGRPRGRILDRIVGRIMRGAAARHRVEVSALSHPGRGPAAAADARHLAMYLIHIGLGQTLTDTGRYFGRDRTTVAHACRRIEERRDDPALDHRLDRVEAMILRCLDRCEEDNVIATGEAE